MTIYKSIQKAQSHYAIMSADSCTESMGMFEYVRPEYRVSIKENRIRLAVEYGLMAQALSIMLDNMPDYVAEMEV